MMAKSLIRNRHAVTKLHALKSQLQAVSLRIQVTLREEGAHKGGGAGCVFGTPACSITVSMQHNTAPGR